MSHRATSGAVAAVERAEVVEVVADRATYEEALSRPGYTTRCGVYKRYGRLWTAARPTLWSSTCKRTCDKPRAAKRLPRSRRLRLAAPGEAVAVSGTRTGF